MADIFIPTLHTFAMNNLYTGSCGALRFRAVPKVVMASAKEVDMEASSIEVQLWHGPFCYEKSTVEQTQVFPMSEAGRLALKAWLEANI